MSDLQDLSNVLHYVYLQCPSSPTGYYVDWLEEFFAFNNKRNKTARQFLAGKIAQKAKEGVHLYLPYRLSFNSINRYWEEPNAKINEKNGDIWSGSAKAQFRTYEDSPIKSKNQGWAKISIWKKTGHPCIFYGVITTENEKGKLTRAKGDLVVFRASTFKTIDLYIFPGAAKKGAERDNLARCIEYVENQPAVEE